MDSTSLDTDHGKKKITNLMLFTGEKVHIQVRTDEEYIVRLGTIVPMIDTHVHLQSLNATPLPNQWMQILKLFSGKLSFCSERFVNDVINFIIDNKTKPSKKDFVDGLDWLSKKLNIEIFRIGRMPTDLVVQLYMGKLQKDEVYQRYLIFISQDKKRDSFAKQQEELSRKRNEYFNTRFYSKTGYYYEGKQVFHMSCMLPMDLSFAHYWGQFGLPVYLPYGETELVYINDFNMILKNWVKLYILEWFSIEKFLLPIKDLVAGYSGTAANDEKLKEMIQNEEDKRKIGFVLTYLTDVFYPGETKHYTNLNYKFPFLDAFKSFHDYLKRMLITPNMTFFQYLKEKDKLNKNKDEDEKKYPLYHMFFESPYPEKISDILDKIREYGNIKNKDTVTDREKKKLHNRITGTLSELKNYYDAVMIKQGKIMEYNEDEDDCREVQRMAHMITIVKDEKNNSPEAFEDYKKQIMYTQKAAVMYPYQLITFYHYDPRRHYPGDDTTSYVAGKVNDLENNHLFIRYKRAPEELLEKFPDQRSLVDPWIKQIMKIWVEQSFDRDYFEDLISKLHFSNTRTFESMFTPSTDGVFWGCKIYPTLGYGPDQYNSAAHRGEMRTTYDSLKEFYSFCEKNNVPIIVHCAPNGMNVADPQNFKDEYETENIISECFNYIELSLDHPKWWGPVLLDFPDLKVCLAHFGGFEAWKGDWKKQNKPEFDWRETLTDLVQQNNNVYLDLAYFITESQMVDYIPSISELNGRKLTSAEKEVLKKGYRYYYDIGIYALKAENTIEEIRAIQRILWKYGIFTDRVEQVASQLADFIAKNEKLTRRIMIGTDWFILEADSYDNVRNYCTLFDLMKALTVKTGEERDYWHQFAVVNPLRFLGLLTEEEPDNAKLDTKKLERYGECLLKQLNGKVIINGKKQAWYKQAGIEKSKKDEIPELIEKRILQLKNCRIKNAKEIKKDGRLIILQ
jgi:hypothetical protein